MRQKGGWDRTSLFQRLCQEDQAADATEYALMLALIALSIAAGVRLVGTNLANGFTGIANKVPGFSTP